MSNNPDSHLYQRIYGLVRQVPPGRVATYGQIGRLIGCTPRTVGFAMAALPPGSQVPWHRVINSQGRISLRADGDGAQVQQLLLEAEGVRFDSRQKVDLAIYRWTFGEA